MLRERRGICTFSWVHLELSPMRTWRLQSWYLLWIKKTSLSWRKLCTLSSKITLCTVSVVVFVLQQKGVQTQKLQAWRLKPKGLRDALRVVLARLIYSVVLGFTSRFNLILVGYNKIYLQDLRDILTSVDRNLALSHRLDLAGTTWSDPCARVLARSGHQPVGPWLACHRWALGHLVRVGRNGPRGMHIRQTEISLPYPEFHL